MKILLILNLVQKKNFLPFLVIWSLSARTVKEPTFLGNDYHKSMVLLDERHSKHGKQSPKR